MSDTMVILGSCGSAREAYWVLQESNPGAETLFVNDLPEAQEMNVITVGGRQIEVIHTWDFSNFRKHRQSAFRKFICGMGDPVVKRILVHKALAAGLEPAPTQVSSNAFVRPDCSLGRGGVVHPGAYLFTNVCLGDYVTFFCARCGHDCIFGDYATCTSGCNIAGHTVIGEGVHLGLGTAVRQSLTIAPWVTVGMQSAVVKDLTQPGIVAFGAPAVKVRNADFPQPFLDTWPSEWLRELRHND
ncbi:MAG TPA: hypothetical protein PLL36_10420 [Candidatus Hydrogenedentes bacterium]|nr:hypothetical protein [Candidatus Hydrogenedentota bacterium]HQN01482.1 hypothetical protein [Candidatus Hydrogenedentota bacterium]